MGFFDSFRKEQKAKEPKVEIPEGKLLTTLLKGTESDMVSHILKKEGQDDLAERLAAGTLVEGDLKILEEIRVQVNKRLEQIEMVKTSVTEDTVEEYAKNSPKFLSLIGLVGRKEAAKAINEQMKKLAMEDEDRFDELCRKFDKITNFTSEVDKDIKEMCAKYNMTEATYQKALNIKDPAEQRKFLQRQVHDSYTGFMKFRDLFGSFSKQDAIGLINKKEELMDNIEEVDESIKSVGDYLTGIVDENDFVREAFTRKILEEKPPKVDPEPTFKEIRAEMKEFSPADVDQKWQEVRTNGNFDTISPTKQNKLRKDFIKELEEQFKARQQKIEKKSSWLDIFSNFFTNFLGSKTFN